MPKCMGRTKHVIALCFSSDTLFVWILLGTQTILGMRTGSDYMAFGVGVSTRAPLWDLCGQGAGDNAGSGALHCQGLEGKQLHAGMRLSGNAICASAEEQEFITEEPLSHQWHGMAGLAGQHNSCPRTTLLHTGFAVHNLQHLLNSTAASWHIVQ